MIIVLKDVSHSTSKGCQVRRINVIPSGFESMLAIFYSPAILSGLPHAKDESFVGQAFSLTSL